MLYRGGMRTHTEIDSFSLELHRLAVDKIRENPALFTKVEATLSRWRSMVSPAAQPYLDEWNRLIEDGVDACLSVAVEDSERGRALRQSSPFSGVLTHKDRFAFLKAWAQKNAA